jgi:hypothetical protein
VCPVDALLVVLGLRDAQLPYTMNMELLEELKLQLGRHHPLRE